MTDDLIDTLNHESLLNLALEQGGEATPLRPYTLPSTEELANTFPELEFIELIGTGGMGCVYKARQIKLDRLVAVKILPRELAADGLFAERFSREARAMARMNHPNLVSVHDFGVAGSLNYLIMEYMDGMNLRELMDAGTLTPPEALSIFEKVCTAISFAHQEGVVHRDIKPENILFDRRGHLAVADFGLARLAMDSTAAVSLTQTRQAMGTLNYMAPEQWEDPKSVDHRADVYALGILLYEMLTGRIPRGTFPPASNIAEVDPAVDEIIHRSLQSAADRRYQNVHELVAALSGDTAAAPGWRIDQNGTFTNLLQIGAKVARAVPLPRTPPHSPEARSQRQVMILSITSLVLTFAGCLAPWCHRDRTYYSGMEVYTVVDTVMIPAYLVVVAASFVVGLSICRRWIGALRTDLLCLALGIAAITLVAGCLESGMGVHGRSSSPSVRRATIVTLLPFLVIAVQGLHSLEVLIRLLQQAYLPFSRFFAWIAASFARFCEWVGGRIEMAQLSEDERKAKRRKIWKSRWDGVVSAVHQLKTGNKKK